MQSKERPQAALAKDEDHPVPLTQLASQPAVTHLGMAQTLHKRPKVSELLEAVILVHSPALFFSITHGQ